MIVAALFGINDCNFLVEHCVLIKDESIIE